MVSHLFESKTSQINWHSLSTIIHQTSFARGKLRSISPEFMKNKLNDLLVLVLNEKCFIRTNRLHFTFLLRENFSMVLELYYNAPKNEDKSSFAFLHSAFLEKATFFSFSMSVSICIRTFQSSLL